MKIGKKTKRGRKSRRKNCLIRDEPPNPSAPDRSSPNPLKLFTTLTNYYNIIYIQLKKLKKNTFFKFG
jgi:hypothetical protein